jgi:hypothetical protein
MEVLEQKKELVDWILTLENPAVLNIIYNIKKEESFNFDEEFSKGLTVEEFGAEMKRRIRNFPLRK